MGREPIRTCLGCRGRDRQANLVRLVRLGGALVVATKPRRPGRGGYLHPAAGCLALAERRGAFRRAFGGLELTEELRNQLRDAPGWNPDPVKG